MTSHVFTLFEGSCPRCFKPVRAIALSGVDAMLEELAPYAEEVRSSGGTVRSYINPNSSQAIAHITFRCDDCSSLFSLDNMAGDWIG